MGLLLSLLLGLLGGTTMGERSTVDRPDDSPEAQVHAVYVLPNDGADESLDVNGVIAGSLASARRWFAAQAGGRQLRFDTCEGRLDITFFRLGRTDAEIRSHGVYVRDQIEAEMREAGFRRPNKLYLVYYGGGCDTSCGGAPWPPDLPGNVTALYLKGEPPGARPCGDNPFAGPDDEPGYWEFSALHEIFHALGGVAEGAPHHTRRGHVSDDPRDLMYAGDEPWRPALLDTGHDDYFDHGRAELLDLARSAFLDPLPEKPVLPPAWPSQPPVGRFNGLSNPRATESMETDQVRVGPCG